MTPDEQCDRHAPPDDPGRAGLPSAVDGLVADHERQAADDHRPAQRVVESAADPGQPHREGDDPERRDGDLDHERTLRLRWPTQLQRAGPGEPQRHGAGPDRGDHRGPLLSRHRAQQDRRGCATNRVRAIGHADRGCPDRTLKARRDERDGHRDDECGTDMPDEARRHEDRTGGDDQAHERCEQLDDQTAQDDLSGSSRIAHGAAEEDQSRRADRGQKDQGLELWVPSDGFLDGWLGGSPDLRVHRRRDEGDGADEQRACCYRVAEQAGDGGGESWAAHVGDPSGRRRRLRRRHLDEPALSPRR